MGEFMMHAFTLWEGTTVFYTLADTTHVSLLILPPLFDNSFLSSSISSPETSICLPLEAISAAA